MERTLLWSAFVIGCLGWVCVYVFARPRRAPATDSLLVLPRSYAISAVLIPLLVFVGTLPSRAPFAPGQGLGRGFLVGALGAWLSGVGLRAVFGRPAGGEQERAVAVAPSGPLFLGLSAVALPLLTLRSASLDALLGVAVGWFVISFLLIGAWIGQTSAGRRASLTQSAGVGFVVTLVALAALGGLRDSVRFTSAAIPVAWSAPGLAFAACVPLLVLFSALLTRPLAHAGARLPGAGLLVRIAAPFVRGDDGRNAMMSMARLLPAALVGLLVARMFQMRLEGRPALLSLTGAGLVAGVLCWWLGAEEVTARRTNGTPQAVWQSRGLAALVILSTVMVAYQWFAGFGVAWMLLGGWLVVGCVLGGISAASEASDTVSVERAARLIALMLFGVVIALYRLFAARFRHDLEGVEITDHYALFGILIGAIVPPLLTSFLTGSRNADADSAKRGIGRIIAAAAITLFVPAVVLILFGAKCALALFFGLALASVLSTPTRETNSGSDESDVLLSQLMPGLFALAIALALTQWTHHILPLALYARAAKVRALGLIVGALVVVILAADYGDRLHRWLSARRQVIGTPGSRHWVRKER